MQACRKDTVPTALHTVKSSLLPCIELDGMKTTEPKSHTSIRASVRNRCTVSNHLSKPNNFYPYTV
jgi:hypothetical protein